MKKKNVDKHLEGLKKAGFDLSYYNVSYGIYVPWCSGCEMTMVGQQPVHKAGCKNYGVYVPRRSICGRVRKVTK
jgi:hypothetical protein